MRFPSGDGPPTCVIRYDVTALSSPGLLSAVLAPFARRSLIPDSVRARRDGESTVVEIVLDGMSDEQRAGCEANLRQLVDVLHVGVVSVPRCGQDAAGGTLHDRPHIFFSMATQTD